MKKLFSQTSAKQIDMLSQHVPTALTGHIPLIALVAYAVFELVEPLVLLAWCVAQFCVLAFRYHTVRQHVADTSRQTHTQRYWAFQYLLGAALSGIVWGSSVGAFQLGGNSSYVFFIVSIIAGIGGVSILTLGYLFPIFAAMVIPLMGLPMMWLFLQQDGIYWASGISLFLGMSYLLLTGRVYSRINEAGVRQTIALSLSEQRFRDVSEAAGEYLWETDVDLLYSYVSDKSLSVKGIPPATLLGHSPMEFMYPEEGKGFEVAARRAIANKSVFSFQHRNIGANGAVRWEGVSALPICDAGGVVTGLRGAGMDITEQKKADETIWQQANLDALTQLPNRRLFNERLKQAIADCQHKQCKLAVLFLDLDKFKEVNDALGHKTGDALLMAVAKRIRHLIPEQDTVAHFGGDEFSIILSDLEAEPHARTEEVLHQIFASLSKPFALNDEVLYISASIGVALFPSSGDTAEQLLTHADQAMYLAKTSGRNQYRYFTPALQAAAIERKELISDLRHALADDQLELHFQSIVELSSGHIHKAEALLRWTHPVHGPISPARFIPLAEETGLINPIGDWVFKEAANWAKRWSGICEDFQVSVNKSPIQFLSQRNDKEWLFEHLTELALPGSHIVIEITEGLMLEADSSVQEKLARMQAAGIQVAIDDFGTGYSALSYLSRFNFDYVKIDQSFVRDLETIPSNLALCDAIIVMAHKLGLKVIAEGIETEQQRQLLAEMSCDYGQGYFWSKPVPPEVFEQHLLSSRN